MKGEDIDEIGVDLPEKFSKIFALTVPEKRNYYAVGDYAQVKESTDVFVMENVQ